jgi:hypothetical protein
MTPPLKPENTSDEIVDMTPANSPQGDSEDEIEDMTPMVVRGDQAGETEDMADADESEYEPVEEPALALGSPIMPERSPADRGVLSSPVRAPAHTMEEEPPGQQPKSGNKRLKTIILVLLGLVALVYVGHKVLGSSLGLIGGNSGAQSTPAQVTSVPTPKTVQIGNQKITTAIGPLILLNPGVVRQGTALNVNGSGFDPGSVVQLSITRQGSAIALASKQVKTDKYGSFYGIGMTVPTSLSAGTFNVVAQERNSSHSAQAFGSVAGGAPQVKLGPEVGQPGEVVTVSLNGFAPMETIKVYWNTMSGQPLTTFQADGGGGIGQGHLRVPYGAVGNNTFLFVGAKSLSLVAANFLMLNLYPTVKLSSYAIKADNMLSFTGKGFGPGEPVLVFLNSTQSQPLAVVAADNNGGFKNAPGFVIPYILKGKQTLIFMGEQSRAPETVTFTVLPYSPLVEPSTYGGLPGTAISFYVSGFAPSEVVHVYAGHTKSTLGNMVGCFETNGQGRAVNVGSYVIPGSAQGALGFALVGAKSGGVGTASVNVTAPPAPVQTPPQAPFKCPLDAPAQQPPQSGAGPTSSSQSQSLASAAPTAPQGSVALPGSHQIASVSTAVSLVTALPAETGLTDAVTTSLLMSQPFNAQVSARAFESSSALRAQLGNGSPARPTFYDDLGYLSLASIVDGAGLLLVITVVILTCILIRRSYQLEIGSPPYARRRELRWQLRPERESAGSEKQQSPPGRFTWRQRQRSCRSGELDGAGRERHQTQGGLHSTVPPIAVGRTTVHASRSYWAARIASRPVSCRCASRHRLTPKDRSP